MLNKDENKVINIKAVLWGVLVLFLLGLKVFHLDADLPHWNIMFYTPIDEGPYAMQAHRFARPEIIEQVKMLNVEGMKEWNSSVSFLLTLFTTLSLKLFGNNYYGLRMGAVFASFIISFIILYNIGLMKHKNDVRKYRIAYFFAVMELAFGFSFVFASRVVEPSIFRSLLILITVTYVYNCHHKNMKINYYILGILSTLTVTWGYVTNVFVFFAIGILLIWDLIEYKNWKIIFEFILGCIICFLTSEIIMKIIQDRTFFEDTIRILGHEKKRVTLSLERIISNMKAMICCNMFSYNIVFFVLAIFSEGYCLITGFLQKNRAKVYSSMLVLGFFMQGLLTNDFAKRKTIVLFPIFIVLICQWIIESFEKSEQWKKIIDILIILLLSIFGWKNLHYRINLLSDVDMSLGFKHVFVIVSTISVLMMILAFVIKNNKCRWGIVITLLLISDLCMDYEYIVKMNKTEKELMITLGESIGNDYVLGFGYSYCLYNDIIPVSNSYDSYYEKEYVEFNTKVLDQNKVKYYLGYHESKLNHFDKVSNSKNYKWQEKNRFYTYYNVEPDADEIYDIYLYVTAVK